MRHQVFFEALAEMSDENTDWLVIMVGYLIVGLFDDWCLLGPAMISGDARVDNIRARIDTFSAEHAEARRLFLRVLETLVEAGSARAASVSEPMLEYAALLEDQHRWSIAEDVYYTVAAAIESDHMTRGSDYSIAAFARRCQGACFCFLHNYTEAEHSYAAAITLAERAKDPEGRLFAEYGLAKLASVRGDASRALSILDALLAECDSYPEEIAARARMEILHLRESIVDDRGTSESV